MRRKRITKRRDPQRLHWAVGALSAVVLAVVMYVSYTALNGLPGQSSHDVVVELPDASRLVKNDTVRIHGVRVGRVAKVDARAATRATPAYARITLALDGSAPRLSVDSKVRTRAASVLGESYVELTPGTSSTKVPDGGTLPLRNATSTVELTDLFSLFESSTRRNIRDLTASAGYGLAGRGPALNELLDGIGRLMAPLETVSATLVDPSTRLARWIRSYDKFTGALGPVSPELAGLVHGGSETFDALAGERPALASALAALPTAETAATRALARVNPSLGRLADFAVELRPAGRRLAPSLTATNRALLKGAPTLRRVPSFASRLGHTLGVLEAVTRRPTTGQTLRKLSAVVTALQPTVQALESAQVNCNVIPILLQNVLGLAGFPLLGRNPETDQPIYAAMVQITHLGAEGEILQQSRPSRNVGINYLPREDAHECEAGNELHDAVTQELGNPPGYQGKAHLDTSAPADAVRRAREAGLLDRPKGWRP